MLSIDIKIPAGDTTTAISEALHREETTCLNKLLRGEIEFRFSEGPILRSEGAVIGFYMSLMSSYTDSVLFSRGSYVDIDYETFIFVHPVDEGVSYYHYDPAGQKGQLSIGSSNFADIRAIVKSVTTRIHEILEPAQSALKNFVVRNPYTNLRLLLRDSHLTE